MNFFHAPGILYSAAAPLDLMSVYTIGATSTKFLAVVTYGIKSTGTMKDIYAVISSDDGVNWTRIGSPFYPTYTVSALVYASGIDTVFAVDNGGSILKSTDAGVTWALLPGSSALIALSNQAHVNNPNGGEGIGVLGAAVSADGQVIMLPGVSISYTMYGSSSRGSLYKSLDGGATWSNLVYASAYLNGYPSKVATNNAGMWVTVGQYGGTYTYATWNYITYSTNNGATWTAVPSQTAPAATTTAGYGDVAYANNMWMACGWGRIAYSTDGINWTNVTTGLPSAVYFNSIAYGNGKWLIISPASNVAYTSTDGLSWTVTTAPFAAVSTYSAIKYANSTFVVTDQVRLAVMT